MSSDNTVPPNPAAVGQAEHPNLQQNPPHNRSQYTEYDKRLSHHRKSSIPFLDRAPKIKFNTIETRITSVKPGPYKPITGKGGSKFENKKSNLKDSNFDHPILVDQHRVGLVSLGDSNPKQLTNEEMIFCAAITDNASIIFANAERRTRGAVDILTFPSISTIKSSHVETLGRIKKNFVIIAEGLERLATQYGKAEIVKTERMRRIVQEMLQLKDSGRNIFICTKKLFKYNSRVYKQWSKLLNKSLKATAPLYAKGMPENVTVYEDSLDLKAVFQGTLDIIWSPGKLIFTPDEDDTYEMDFMTCPIEIQFDFIREVIQHVSLMILYSGQNILKALEIVQDPTLSEGYDTIQSRILDLEFDSFFDPACVLELKTALGELVQRKAVLLNITEKTLEAMELVKTITKDLHKFASQIYCGQEGGRGKGKCVLLCCVKKFIRYKDLVKRLYPKIQTDLVVPVPFNSNLQRIV